MPTSDPGEREDGTVRGRDSVEAADRDPVPGDVHAAAKEAYLCRWVEANVAALMFDSLLDGASRWVPRHLVFRGKGLTVEVDVAVDRSLTGRLVPPCPTEVVLRWPGGSTPTRCDEQGCFTLPRVPRGRPRSAFRPPPRAGQAPWAPSGPSSEGNLLVSGPRVATHVGRAAVGRRRRSGILLRCNGGERDPGACPGHRSRVGAVLSERLGGARRSEPRPRRRSSGRASCGRTPPCRGGGRSRCGAWP